MEFRDAIHGTIKVTLPETRIIESPFFQRLRNIKQLGFAENSYPGATHNRFSHSIGALHTAELAFNSAFRETSDLKSKHPKEAKRLLNTIRIAAMLHDVGHGPLSHTTEFAMPPVTDLKLASIACLPGKKCAFDGNRRANHEDYTLKIILQSSMTDLLKDAYAPMGIEPIHIACVINDDIHCPDDFFKIEGINYRPILHQLISSEIDVDRMDYLCRDSINAGVNYGRFDFSWMLANLTNYVQNGNCYLALGHKALYTFDDFLVSRFHMFLMVYFHHKSVIYDELLGRYLQSDQCDYEIPSDIESYIFFDDYHLYTHLSRSSNEWAKRVYHKKPYRMYAEFHSGIPEGKVHKEEQKKLLEKIQLELEEKGIDYIVKTTVGEFSKYFGKDGSYPIFVRYDNKYSPEKYIPLEECTDLFKRYPEKRSITRIYVPS